MKRFLAIGSCALVLLLVSVGQIRAQKSSVGGRLGFSLASGGGASEAGLQIGATYDYEFNKGMAVGTEFNINTQTGTPIEWANYFKYFISIKKPNISPYVDGGFNLWFVTGGPYFGLRFGGGAYFKIAPNLYIPADLQFGPIFVTGTSAFYLAITSGIRYTLP